ncbi:FecR family protein [Malaciobacter mytili]|uniref:FecR family protein n=1 Tax=Malaciobacter mytili TaxID=603050 RepID=UPI003BB026EB
MKKILIICLFFTTFLFANVAKVVAITGEALIIRDTVKLKLEKDSDIFKNDEIETKQNTKVQLIFKDNTIITIGKNSTFKINDYIFDEKNKEYKAQFGLIQGTFRTITGKIGKLAPEKFKLKSKNSSIGIRGTQILSNIQENREIIFCTEGTIEIVSLLTNEVIIINAGEYIELKANEPIQIKKFDTTSILETDENTKFLSTEETENYYQSLVLI